MKWNIIADSSCDLKQLTQQAADTRYATVPFAITVGETEYLDDEALDLPAFLDSMEHCPTASRTACPSPQAWYEEFVQGDQTIAVTISGKLSGSHDSAQLALRMLEESHPEKKVCIIDSRSTGPEPAMIVETVNRMIRAGHSFEEVCLAAQRCADETHILFVVSSFENLVKNGRVSRMVGFVAGLLSMRAIGCGSDEGKIILKHKTRSLNKTLSILLDEMRARGYAGGRVVISHCQNEALAVCLSDLIEKTWQGAKVSTLTTRGLCSYYAERAGLMVAFR